MDKISKIAIYERFEKDPKKFNLNWLKEQNNSSIKHVQLYINNNPILRIGCMYHKSLLQKTLTEFNIEFSLGVLPMFENFDKIDEEHKGPLIIGKDYKMVGAGKIRLNQNLVEFYDCSSHYSSSKKFLSTNKKHLEEIIELNNWKMLSEEKGKYFEPCFLVKIN